MKISKINDTDYKIYYYKDNINKDCLYDRIRDIIKSIQKRLKLKGFYKVVVFCKKIGLFIQLIYVDDNLYKNILDLKIEIIDDDVYFKTSDYFVIKDLSNIRYFNNMYYVLVNDDFDRVLDRIEFGEFLFGYDVLEIIDKTYVI